MKSLKTLVLTGAVALCSAVSASANDPYCGPQYRKVVVWVVRYETYTVCETRYDRCGNPYTVHVKKTRPVRVPVVKWVPAC